MPNSDNNDIGFELLDPGQGLANFDTPDKPQDISSQTSGAAPATIDLNEGQTEDNNSKKETGNIGDDGLGLSDFLITPDSNSEEDLSDFTLENENADNSSNNKKTTQASTPNKPAEVTFAETLAARLGVEMPEDDFFKNDYTPEKLYSYMEDKLAEKVDAKVEEEINALDPENQEAARLARDGVDLNRATLLGREKTNVIKLRAGHAELEDDILKKIVIAEYKMKNYAEEDIPALVEKIVESGNLKNRSLASLDYLESGLDSEIAEEKSRVKELESIKIENAKKETQSFQDYLENTKELVSGIPITGNMKKKIKDSFSKVVGYDENKKPMNGFAVKMAKNPQAVKTMLHYLDAAGVFDLDKDGNLKPDFSDLKSRLLTVQTKQGKQNLAQQSSSHTGGTGYTPNDDNFNEDEVDETLAIFESMHEKFKTAGRPV
jgi:hypothetical protein